MSTDTPPELRLSHDSSYMPPQQVEVHLVGFWSRCGEHIAWERSISYTGQGKRTIQGISPTEIHGVLSPLACPGRIRLLQALVDGAQKSSALRRFTGQTNSALQYHLQMLQAAGYVNEHAGLYNLTPLGCQMLIMVSALAQVATAEHPVINEEER